MSKKRDDSYFAAGRRKQKKYLTIIVPIIVAVIGIGVAAAVLVPRGSIGGFGMLNSAHEHAVFAVILDGQQIDFSQSKYQVGSTRNSYIHMEGGDGTTLHRHSTNVPVGEFLKSVKMDISNNCFVRDDGQQFCNDGAKQLRSFVNGTEQAIMDYVLKPNDRILVIYGDETQDELAAEFDKLNSIEPKG